jgi:hypothetical protein
MTGNDGASSDRRARLADGALEQELIGPIMIATRISFSLFSPLT